MDPRHGSARSSPFTSPAPASTSDSCDLLIEDDRGTSFTRNSLFLFDDEVDMDNELDEMDDRSVLHYELGFYEKSGDNCYRGTLTFALRYDFIHRVLMLHVLRANHLPVEEKGRTVDPYVKMYLLPERRNHCKTRICKKTLDPDFNEMFSFDVAFNSLSGRMLQFTVYDFDRFTRHGLIGNVIMRDLFDKSDLYTWTEYTMQIVGSQFTVYDFDRFTRHGLIGNVIMRDLFDKSDLYTWTEYTMQIVGSQEKNDFGDLLLYLLYSPNEQKLYVTVAKAYNLRPMDITGASDPYVKVEQVYRGKRVKLRKSTCKRANLNPVYHETLEYDLPLNQVAETNFLVQVMDWDRIGKDDLLGCCVLGKDSPTVEGRTQWENCFLSLAHTEVHGQKRKPVGQWHSILSEVPEQFRNIPKAKK
ncbi:C2 domain protein [Ancylostoma ceylanicum]|uniref:C2 domain protein n=1 Tax=Ancylostoma ceylanicum TaxID=53326 RepID=A0A0D6M7I4_9BILA|nr:C2 domain protein [Ancylostoma ceylanicum]